jgi:hypothetical protein
MEEQSEHPIDTALAKSLLLPMILGTIVLGGLFGVLGVLLVYLGAKGNSHIALFGQSIETADVGVASLFIAAVLVVVTLRRVLKSIDGFKTIQKKSVIYYDTDDKRE